MGARPVPPANNSGGSSARASCASQWASPNWPRTSSYMTAEALVMALRAAGRDLNRAAFVKTVESSKFDLGGVTLRYGPGNHEGSQFVDLSMVARDGRFIH